MELVSRLPLDFELDDAHVASAPAEARGLARDEVRLMISRGDDEPVHATFRDLADHLAAGDLLVVNTSATVPAAVDAELSDGTRLVVHVSTQLPGGLWMVEPRRPLPGGATSPLVLPPAPTIARLVDGTAVAMLRPAPGSQRLWLATVDSDVDLLTVLVAVGRPIRYSYVDRDWPIDSYQTVFADQPGSAEMPSAARPFTADLTTRLISRGIGIVTITLHTGVSSLEGHELPYAERFAVSAGDRGRGQRDPGGRRPRDRRGHHRRAGTRVGRRRDRDCASRRRVDRRRDHAGDGRPRRRRPRVGLARAGRHAPGDARGGRRTCRARSGRTGRRGMPATCGTSSATATCCFRTLVVDDRDDNPRRDRIGRRRCVGAAATARRASSRAVRGAPDR